MIQNGYKFHVHMIQALSQLIKLHMIDATTNIVILHFFQKNKMCIKGPFSNDYPWMSLLKVHVKLHLHTNANSK
jgi:hypothetical protein